MSSPPSSQIITRRKARIKVFQALFAQLSTGDSPGVVFDQLLAETFQALRKQEKPVAVEDDAAFLKQLYDLSLAHQAEYMEWVGQKLANWDLARVARADQVLILMGIVEMAHFAYIPVSVTINEYIEISREFSTEKSGTFINGVLDAMQAELKAKGLLNKKSTLPLPPAGK